MNPVEYLENKKKLLLQKRSQLLADQFFGTFSDNTEKIVQSKISEIDLQLKKLESDIDNLMQFFIRSEDIKTGQLVIPPSKDPAYFYWNLLPPETYQRYRNKICQICNKGRATGAAVVFTKDPLHPEQFIFICQYCHEDRNDQAKAKKE